MAAHGSWVATGGSAARRVGDPRLGLFKHRRAGAGHLLAHASPVGLSWRAASLPPSFPAGLSSTSPQHPYLSADGSLRASF